MAHNSQSMLASASKKENRISTLRKVRRSKFEVTQILITLFSRDKDGSLARALVFPVEACCIQSGSSSVFGNLGKYLVNLKA